ncbi:MAG: Na+/H+ antiporter subunit E [Bacillota bacterium]
MNFRKNNVKFQRISKTLIRRTRPRIVLALMIFWIILTGSLKMEFVLTGLAISLFITTFWGGFIISPTPGKDLLVHPSLIYIILKYLKDFVLDVVKANYQVARIVLSPELPIKPGFVKYNLDLDFEISRVLLANSITLTPGTLTVYLSRRTIVVHALTEEAARDLMDWEVEKDLKKFEEVEKE